MWPPPPSPVPGRRNTARRSRLQAEPWILSEASYQAGRKLARYNQLMPDKNTIALRPEIILDEEGKPRSVILSIAEYEALLELLEDVSDSIVFDKAVEKSTGLRDLADVVEDLERDGLV